MKLTAVATAFALAVGLGPLSPVGTAFAQDAPHFRCATPEIDISITRANIAAAKAFAKTHRGAHARGAITYIPIRFVRIGDSDLTRAARPFDIVTLLEAINRDFAPYDWRFYLTDEDGVPFDSLFDDDRNSGDLDNRPFFRENRNPQAVTMYLVADATPESGGEGVTLGYYDPSIDILVVRNAEVGNDAATATHELGHYFGLPHTFRGWEPVTWDGAICTDSAYNSPVTPVRAPNRTATVELVARDSAGNCDVAGDLFCDTNADYNFGFGYPDCDYNGPVVDRNGDQLMPDEDNFMSYFQDCRSYRFSDGQFAAVRADLRSSRRDFLREAPAPITLDSVRERAVITSPSNNTVTASGEVALAWASVPGATYYFVEVASERSFVDRSAVLQRVVPAAETSVLLADLDPERSYFARVTAFNQLTVSTPSRRVQFRTPSVTAVSVPDALPGVALAPNPVNRGSRLEATLHAEHAGVYRLSIRDATGRLVRQQEVTLQPGSNRASLATDELGGGAYVLQVRSDWGVSTRRFVVQ